MGTCRGWRIVVYGNMDHAVCISGVGVIQKMSKYKLVIERSVDGQFVVTLRSARNGQTVLTSETYKRKQAAKRAADNLTAELGCPVEDRT